MSQKLSKKKKASKKYLNPWILATAILGVCLLAVSIFAIGNRFTDKSINNENSSDSSSDSNSESSSDAQNNVTVNNSNNCIQINEASNGPGCAVSYENKDDYILLFYESGLKLNLGSGFEFINVEYNSDIYDEMIYIGGLTLNNGRAQNTPGFAEGKGRKKEGDDSYQYWDWLARIEIYDEDRWYGHGNGYGNSVYRQVANGERPPFKIVLHKYGYVVIYSAQSTLTDALQWATDWEMETINHLSDRIQNVDNWSKYK